MTPLWVSQLIKSVVDPVCHRSLFQTDFHFFFFLPLDKGWGARIKTENATAMWRGHLSLQTDHTSASKSYQSHCLNSKQSDMKGPTGERQTTGCCVFWSAGVGA